MTMRIRFLNYYKPTSRIHILPNLHCLARSLHNTIYKKRIKATYKKRIKATTGVGESESKRGFLTSFSHSKPCMRLLSRTESESKRGFRLSSHTTPKLSDKRKKNSSSFLFLLPSST